MTGRRDRRARLAVRRTLPWRAGRSRGKGASRTAVPAGAASDRQPSRTWTWRGGAAGWNHELDVVVGRSRCVAEDRQRSCRRCRWFRSCRSWFRPAASDRWDIRCRHAVLPVTHSTRHAVNLSTKQAYRIDLQNYQRKTCTNSNRSVAYNCFDTIPACCCNLTHEESTDLLYSTSIASTVKTKRKLMV